LQITRPTPATLEVRVAPWSLWIIGVVIAAIGAALVLLMQLGWVSDLRCRHDAEGEMRCTLTRSLYGLLPRVTEIRGVTGARVDVSHGSRSTTYRTVLITSSGEVPVQPYHSSGGRDTVLVERVTRFVADPAQLELAVTTEDRTGLLVVALMVLGGLAVVTFTPATTWLFEGGELKVRHDRLIGTRSETHRLHELRYAELQRGSKRTTTRVALIRDGAGALPLTSYYSNTHAARKQEAVEAINAVLAQRGVLNRAAMRQAEEAREIVRQGGREMLGALFGGGAGTVKVRRWDGREVAVPQFLGEALRVDPGNDEALGMLRAILPTEEDRRRFVEQFSGGAKMPPPSSPSPVGAMAPALPLPSAAPFGATASRPSDSFGARLLGLVTFRAPVYRRIAEDPGALLPAALIVAATAALTGFASGLTSAATITVNGQAIMAGPQLAAIQAAAVTISALIGWVVGSALCALAARAMGGRTNTGEMLRVCGHVNLFSLLELALPGGVALVWLLSTVGTVIATREAAEFSTRRAIVAAAIGWGVALVVVGVLRILLTIGAFAASGG
jgi:hypothetical protein